jgi:vitamin B12 transporter
MLSRLASAVLLLLGTPIAFSAEEGTFDLGTINVTATRTAQTADETIAPVTVITREDIEGSQAQSVADLLRDQPGISISNNGGQGKFTSVFLRGANSDQVLVLVDGVKVGSATSGTSAFEDLPLDLIERIEIVRGPQSSLYGSEAIGGVIQIFTRKGNGPLKPSFSLGGGSYGTRQGSAALSSDAGSGGWYSVGLSGFDTHGFPACKSSLTAGCYAIVPPGETDGYENESARLRAGWRFANGTEAEMNWLHTDGDNLYEGSYSNESKSVRQVLGASLGTTPLDAWHTALRAGQSQDDSDDFLNGIFVDRFNTQRRTLSWQNDIELAQGHQLVAGVDWQNDRVTSTTAYALTSRDDTGVFAEYLAKMGAHDIQLAVRRDNDQQFGAKSTGSVAWGYNLNPELRITASFGSAFKAPNFNDLYYPGFSNPSLRPEASHSVNVGLAGKAGAARWSLNTFETQVTDLIGLDAAYIPINIDSARIRGIEGVASARLLDWELRGNLNLLDPENQSTGADNGNVLPRRPKQAISLDANRSVGAWSGGVTVRAESYRYDDLANTIRLGGFTTVDLRTEYRVNKDWRMQARIQNLLNKDYETAYLYNQPGRGVYVMLRYQP